MSSDLYPQWTAGGAAIIRYDDPLLKIHLQALNLDGRFSTQDRTLNYHLQHYFQVTVKLPSSTTRGSHGSSSSSSRGHHHHCKDAVKLSARQWSTLVAFWEHRVFVRSRYVGIALGIIAVVTGIISLTNPDWHRHQGEYLCIYLFLSFGGHKSFLWGH